MRKNNYYSNLKTIAAKSILNYTWSVCRAEHSCCSSGIFTVAVSSNHPVFTSKNSSSYMTKSKLISKTQEKLLWSINSLEVRNSHSIIQPSLQVLLQMDLSKKGWYIVCRKKRTGDLVPEKLQEHYIVLLY